MLLGLQGCIFLLPGNTRLSLQMLKSADPQGSLGTLNSWRTCSAQGLRPVQCTGPDLRPSLSQISNPVTGLNFWDSPERGGRGHKLRQHILVNTPALELLSKQNQRTYCHLLVWPRSGMKAAMAAGICGQTCPRIGSRSRQVIRAVRSRILCLKS